MKRYHLLIVLLITCQPLIAMEMELQQRLSALALNPHPEVPPLTQGDDLDTTEAMESDGEQAHHPRPSHPPLQNQEKEVTFSDLATLIQSLPEGQVWHLIGNHPQGICLHTRKGRITKRKTSKKNHGILRVKK